MYGALFRAVGYGAGYAATVCAGGAAEEGLHGEHAVQVVKTPRHHAGRGVRQVERVAELVQGRADARGIICPVELSETTQKEGRN